MMRRLLAIGGFVQKGVIERISSGSRTMQRELERLSKAEILVRTTEGRQNYYQANHRSPVFEELRGLVRKTFGGHSGTARCWGYKKIVAWGTGNVSREFLLSDLRVERF